MSREEEITRFVAFCIELYKHRHGGDGESVYDLFAQTGVGGFRVDFFDVEPCLGGDQMGDDVERIIARGQKGGVA